MVKMRWPAIAQGSNATQANALANIYCAMAKRIVGMGQMNLLKSVQLLFAKKATSNAAVVHAFQTFKFVTAVRIVLMVLMKVVARLPLYPTIGGATVVSVFTVGMSAMVLMTVRMSLMKGIVQRFQSVMDSHAIQVTV